MFQPEEYLHFVNGQYGSSIAVGDLKSHAPRILVRLKEHTSATPLPKATAFNHFRPARWFTASATSTSLSAQTLDRFEAAFKALNALL